jgi:membrane protease YdiL (CAAX protease family)
MLAVVLLLLVPLIMWVTQSVLLASAKQPLRLAIGADGLSSRARRISRIAANAAILLVIVLYPILRGRSPIAYYAAFFPFTDGHPLQLLHGAVGSLIYLGLLYAAWTVTDNVRFEGRHSPPVVFARLSSAPFSALLGAGVEELLFRAMLLEALLNEPLLNTPSAVAIGVVIFATAHYVRRVKRYWTFAGHIALGTLLCVAFVLTRSLWLPIGLHAGGILLTLGTRPFVRYRGPAWLVGASIYPYAGVTGVVALTLLTINMWLHYGAATVHSR